MARKILDIPIIFNIWGLFEDTKYQKVRIRIETEYNSNFTCGYSFTLYEEWVNTSEYGDSCYMKLSNVLLAVARIAETLNCWETEELKLIKPLRNKFFLTNILLYVEKGKHFAQHTCKISTIKSDEFDLKWFAIPLATEGYEILFFDKTGKEVNREVFYSEAWLQVFLNFYDLNLCTFEQLVQNYAQKISASIDDLRQLSTRRPLLAREKTELDFLQKIQAADTLSILQNIENELNNTPTDPELKTRLLNLIVQKKEIL